MAETHNCPQCGKELPPDAPAGLCPECLLKQGQEVQSAADALNTSPSSGRFDPPSADALAERFPGLEILELLGTGGMGAVYKARQPHLDRLVALKILPPELGRDPAFEERFTREAHSLARLNHPNVVGFYDFGQVDGLFYLVMEYVDGANLRQMIARGRLTPEQALAIVPQICEALGFAHDEGIVHRDIKPENILVDTKGRVKIADFGLAKIVGEPAAGAVTLTGTQQIMGTFHYMAPENLKGSRAVDHRADIYSLGVVFYEMLTGELPVGKFEPPSKKVQVDVRLDEVVLRSLESEPEQRYQHASEVKTDVETIASGTGTVAQAPPEAPNVTEVRSRLRLPAIGLMVAGIVQLVTLIVLVIIFAWGEQIGAIELFWVSLPCPLGLLYVVGAIRMLQVRSYRTAMAAACVTLIPPPGWFLGFDVLPGWLLAIPFGIWCMVLLSDPKVKAAFALNWARTTSSTLRHRPDEHASEVKTDVEKIRRTVRSPDLAVADDEQFDGARRVVRWPAIGLLVVGAFSTVVSTTSLFGLLVWSLRSTKGDIDQPSPILIVTILLPVCVFLLALLMVFGSVQMLRLRSRPWAICAAVLALLPLPAGVFWILSLPLGIWSLVVLVSSEVKALFQRPISSTVAARPAARKVAQSSSPLDRAIHDWWSGREQWLTKSIKAALLVVYVLCLVMFFGSSGSGSRDAWKAEIGNPAPWFVIEKGPIGHEFAVHFSSAWLMAALGLLAYYAYWRIRKIETGYTGKFGLPGSHVLLWSLFAAVSFIVCIFPLLNAVLAVKPVVPMRERVTRVDSLEIGREGPAVGEELMQTLDLRPLEVQAVNDALQAAWREYVPLEEQHSTSHRDDEGHLHVEIAEFADELQRIEQRFWSQLEASLDERQLSVARRHLPINQVLLFGDQNLGLEIWQDHDKNDHFFWKIQYKGPLTTGGGNGSGVSLPPEYEYFWRKADTEGDRKSAP